MTSEEFADRVENAVRAVRGRVLGVGQEQYDDGSGVQRFEGRSIDQILVDALEEVEDLIVYGVQMQIQINKLREEIKLALT